MSTAAVQPVQETEALGLRSAKIPIEITELGFTDQHPLTVLAMFIAVSLGFAVAFVGFLAVWLYAIRDSGVMSVKM
jgi:hypothetical protein